MASPDGGASDTGFGVGEGFRACRTVVGALADAEGGRDGVLGGAGAKGSCMGGSVAAAGEIRREGLNRNLNPNQGRPFLQHPANE